MENFQKLKKISNKLTYLFCTNDVNLTICEGAVCGGVVIEALLAMFKAEFQECNL